MGFLTHVLLGYATYILLFALSIVYVVFYACHPLCTMSFFLSPLCSYVVMLIKGIGWGRVGVLSKGYFEC